MITMEIESDDGSSLQSIKNPTISSVDTWTWTQLNPPDRFPQPEDGECINCAFLDSGILFIYYHNILLFNLKAEKFYLVESTDALSRLKEFRYFTLVKEKEEKMIVYGTIEETAESILASLMLIKDKEENYELVMEGIELKENLPVRNYHTMEICKEKVYIFGGADEREYVKNDLILVKLDGFKILENRPCEPKPCARRNHSSLLVDESKIIIFGGEAQDGGILNDLWILRLDRLSWEQVCPMGVMPWPLTKMIMAATEQSLLIVGGFVDRFTNDILIFDLKVKKWSLETFTKNSQPLKNIVDFFEIREGRIIMNQSLKIYSLAYKNDGLSGVQSPGEKTQFPVYDQGKEIFQQILKFYDETPFHDITFQVGRESFAANRCILALRCPYFQKLLADDFLVTQSKVVEIYDMKPEVFSGLLEYIYKNEIKEIGKVALDLYLLGDKYEMPRLQQYCENYLRKNVGVENLLGVLEIAKRFKRKKLRESVVRFLKKNLKEVFDWVDVSKIKDELLEVFQDQKSSPKDLK